MRTFLEELLESVREKYRHFDNVVFILPSRRAGTFLLRYIAKEAQTSFFAPEIYSIEEFLENVSGLPQASQTELIFTLFEAYSKLPIKKKDSFRDFSKWGPVLLRDFQDIDRYLVDHKSLFDHLRDVREIGTWNVTAGKTELIENYLEFWDQLEGFYANFNDLLKTSGETHQGQIYREAVTRLPEYKERNKDKIHVFAGFSALTTAESVIIQDLIEAGSAEIHWDLDLFFMEGHQHTAGFFIKDYLKDWACLTNNPPKGLSSHYSEPKEIQVIGAPNSVSQANIVGEILENQLSSGGPAADNVALVLGDEQLLNPVLHTLPTDLPSVNITMGYPIQKTPAADLFRQYFELFLNDDPSGWYYRDVLALINHPYISSYLDRSGTDHTTQLKEAITRGNLIHLKSDELIGLVQGASAKLTVLFGEDSLSPLGFIDSSITLISELRDSYEESSGNLTLEYLYHCYTIFNQLKRHLSKHRFLNDLHALYTVFSELIAGELLYFSGEPLSGLQIMGMLESRTLDFETVIVTSVNEGVLPAGKTPGSFIPFDIKKQYNLPTYQEKDAVYTYHFYRLLQRAKKVYLIYDTETDSLMGGEPSRFIRQLLAESPGSHNINATVASPPMQAGARYVEEIQKSTSVMERLSHIAEKGFSPSSLANYIRDPLLFYKRKLLEIPDPEEVEEALDNRAIGIIIHKILEDLYKPFKGEVLSANKLKALLPKAGPLVEKEFRARYTSKGHERGMNLILKEVVKRYVCKMIELDIESATSHEIELVELEKTLDIRLNIPGWPTPVVLKGTIDRIDRLDGKHRVIDYKSGGVVPGDLRFEDWDLLCSDEKYHKAFQVLCYALLAQDYLKIESMECGVISFRNLSEGFMLTGHKIAYRKYDETVDTAFINEFRTRLEALISEVLDPEMPFREKTLI